MHFSLSTLINTIIFSNLLVILLYFIFRNSEIMLGVGRKVLLCYFALTLLRILLPFEFRFTKVIPFPKVLSRLMVLLKYPILSIGNIIISLWLLFEVTWIVGILIGLIKTLRSYAMFRDQILRTGTILTRTEPYATIIHEICEQEKKRNVFHIMQVPWVHTPMIFGIKNPYILIPKNLTLKESDIYYILKHETAHYFHFDLWLKFFIQMLCIVYWWNPFMPLLKKQVSAILEICIDEKVINRMDKAGKAEYMDCLLRVAKFEAKQRSALSISFADTSMMTKRFAMMMCNDHKKARKHKYALISFGIIIIYLFSILFIFEPYYISSEERGTSFELTSDNAYLIQNRDNTYELYVDNQHVNTFDKIPEYLLNLKIYNKGEKQP